MGAVAGISAKEALLMAPGEVFDLFKLARGTKKKTDIEDE